jgi:hypothetical protein
MADKNDFSEIIAELLIKTDKTNELLEKLNQRQENTEKVFNTGFSALLEKLTQIDNKLEKVVDHEERIKRLENIILKAS